MKIHQLSVNYLAEQDRIFVRINTSASEELRLWLTRRLMMGLWPLLSKLLTQHLLKLEAAGSSLEAADEGLKKMLADFRKEQFLQEADFETPYDEDQAVLPLGTDPVLVTDVDATPLPDGRLRLSFNERLPHVEGAAQLPDGAGPQAHAGHDAPAGAGARQVAVAGALLAGHGRRERGRGRRAQAAVPELSRHCVLEPRIQWLAGSP